ncbi:three-Cys-motif partner protein TcmP [Streptomyces sp. NPDC059832]|uniref:three-Cys-motif partner protein TcmP n=1 Tax=Streptomyces sp. NPDC059832 TaxID=3346966 RepID=UPI0036617AF0
MAEKVMATGTDKDYWASQALPSVLKHKLLGQYIPRFGGMTGSRGRHQVVYLDGYAGEGRYESGDRGSAEIAMQVAAHHLEKNALLWNCFFVEQKPDSVARLDLVAAHYRALGVDARVHHGDVDGVLSEVLQVAEGLPLFLFLDPCGLGLPFDRIVQTLNQRRSTPRRWQPTEFLMNFSMDAVRRLGGNARSARGLERSSERFDEACGGRWWREYFRPDEPAEADVDEIVAAQYAQRLREKTGMFVQSVPVARKPGQKAVYHLVFGTRSEHGLWFLGDAVARARDAWWEGLEIKEEQEDPDTLFSATSVVRPDPQEVTDAAVPAMADNMERILHQQKRPFKLLNHTLDVFGAYYGQVTEPAARKAVKLLHSSGRTASTGVGGKTHELVVQPPR